MPDTAIAHLATSPGSSAGRGRLIRHTFTSTSIWRESISPPGAAAPAGNSASTLMPWFADRIRGDALLFGLALLKRSVYNFQSGITKLFERGDAMNRTRKATLLLLLLASVLVPGCGKLR